MRLSFRPFLFGILVVDSERTAVTEAFSVHELTAARVRLFQYETSTMIPLYPQRVDENDFRTPAASFTFTRCATATMTGEFIKSEWSEGGDSTKLSYLDVISSIIPFSKVNDQNLEETNSGTKDEPLAQAHRIQQAYQEWCEFYGKISNRERLGVFASNFLAVQEFHENTGRPLVLNQFADLTEEQYLKGEEQSKNDSKEATIAPEKEAEDRILVAYREWCEYYGRVWDENRLPIFASNYVAVEKYHEHTKMPLVLNEFADMNEQEYEEYMERTTEFTEPESTGSMASDNTPFSQEDPMASYLNSEPVQNPVDFPQVNEVQSSVPSSPTQTVQSDSRDFPESSHVWDASSSTYEVPAVPNSLTQVVQSSDVEQFARLDTSSSIDKDFAALQQTVASLTAMVNDMASATQVVAPRTQAQPLDSLVIDVLQQQDHSISQLEMSIDGLHQIQMQSSDLIELVSNNQKQMTDMMEAVQVEIAALEEERQLNNENYALLLARIEELEEAVAKHDSDDPSLQKALVLAHATATTGRMMVEVKPNIPAIGANPMFKPINLDPQ